MPPLPQNGELLQLTFDLWSEAKTEHLTAAHSQCPACWKAHMANMLWSKVTGLHAPTNYFEDHRAASKVTYISTFQRHRRNISRAA